MNKQVYKLNNGVEVPKIGFGTWKLLGDTAYKAVRMAIEVGYTHIDTAASYDNEAEVGRAIHESSIPREKIFITTKLWNDIKTYEETIQAFERSAQKLGVEVIDLYLIHWPNPIDCRENDAWKIRDIECWRAMEELYKQGRVRAIGVSNFLPHHLDVILERGTVRPAVNQIRLFPGFINEECVSYCEQRDILLEGFSPLGEGNLLVNSAFREMAERYDRSPAQLALRWSVQRGFLPIPKSTKESHAASNLEIFNFEILAEDMKSLNVFKHGCRSNSHPDQAGF